MEFATLAHLKNITNPDIQFSANTQTKHQTPIIKNPGAINDALTKYGDKSTVLANAEEVTFVQAINELMAIFNHDEVEITKSICAFVTGENITEADRKLYEWSAKYHNTKLLPAKGEQFSTSVIRNGLLESMRNFDKNGLSGTETEVVLFAYFEAHNARVISERSGNGSIPDWSFVNTNLAVRCLQALQNNHYSLTPQAQAFMGLKDLPPARQLDCTTLQQEIQAKALNNEIAHMAQQWANQKLSLNHIENNETGADKLVANENQVEQIAKSFQENNVPLSSIKDAIDELTAALSEFDKSFSNLNNHIDDKNQFLLIKWDASEYIGNIKIAIDVALKTVEQLDPNEYEAVSKVFDNRLENMPHVHDILQRNQTGDYRAKERNELLAQVPELERLFRQPEFK